MARLDDLFCHEAKCNYLHSTRTKALEVSLLEQILILLRHHVRLNLTHEIHRNNDHDQLRRTAEVERNIETHVQEFRNQANERKVCSTTEGQT